MKNILMTLIWLVALPAFAQQPAEGEIRKIDRKAKTVTLKHGPIQSIDMPAMTMVFNVKDPAVLEKLKPGDKVRFQAEMLGGEATVTSIERAKPPAR